MMSGMIALRCPECGARCYHEAARMAWTRDSIGEWVAVRRTSHLDSYIPLECSLCRDALGSKFFPLVPPRGAPGGVDPVIEHCAACAAPVLVTGSDYMGALCSDCRPGVQTPETEPLPEIPAQRYLVPFQGPTAVVEARMGSVHFRVRYPLQPERETHRECLWVEDTDHAVCGRPMRFVSAVSLWASRYLTCPDCIAGRRVPWLPVGIPERAEIALRCLDCGATVQRDAARLGFYVHPDISDHLVLFSKETDRLLRCEHCRGLLVREDREE